MGNHLLRGGIIYDPSESSKGSNEEMSEFTLNYNFYFSKIEFTYLKTKKYIL